MITRAQADPSGHHDALRLHGDRMVPPGALDFAVNVHGAEPPDWVREELRHALRGVGRYPDETAAISAVAARHGRDPAEIVLTNGAAEAFWILAAALRPCRAACIHPSFTEPEAALRAYGHHVERVRRRREDFLLEPAAVSPAAQIVTLDNPSNPSGAHTPSEDIAGMCRPGRVVVVDEAFMDFVPGEPQSLSGRGDLPGLVVVRSLTKIWSLAGVRAGYLLAPAGIAAAIRRMRPPWSVNALALAAIRAGVGRVDEARAIAHEVAAARVVLRGGLLGLPGVRTWPSAANFVLARVADGPGVHRRLRERGMAVRPLHTFPFLDADYLRLTVRDASSNAALLEALAESL